MVDWSSKRVTPRRVVPSPKVCFAMTSNFLIAFACSHLGILESSTPLIATDFFIVYPSENVAHLFDFLLGFISLLCTISKYVVVMAFHIGVIIFSIGPAFLGVFYLPLTIPVSYLMVRQRLKPAYLYPVIPFYGIVKCIKVTILHACEIPSQLCVISTHL